MSCFHLAALSRRSLVCGATIPPPGHASFMSKGSRRCESGPRLTCQHGIPLLVHKSLCCPTSVAQKIICLPFLPPPQLPPPAPLCGPPSPLGRAAACHREPAHSPHSGASERTHPQLPLLLTWLDEYWCPISDSSVLPRLCAFAVWHFDGAGLM
ncbi:hypothetical protein B0H12DRAFT_1097427 [Mycena haematopus]|nr:hypothetical protein B0H12DRAFT_1097427 [Mycena haematopus]